jgi:hypothetical protein
MKFEKGTRVITTRLAGHKRVANVVGSVLFVKQNGNICVEFDENIEGHDGGDYDMDTGKYTKGKDYHCWFVNPKFLKHLNINKRIA